VRRGVGAELRDMLQPLKFSILGDSVMRCPGLHHADKLRVQLKAALQAHGYDVTLRNNSLEGATSADGISHVDWVLSYKPDVVLLSLGANDSFALGNDNIDEIERNLAAIIRELRSAGVVVLLAGMRVRFDFQWRYRWRMLAKALVNSALEALGQRPFFHANSLQYARKFNGIYGRVAEREGVPLYPYLLEGVRRGMWHDMYHLNAKGVQRVVEQLAPFIVANIRSAPATAPRDAGSAPDSSIATAFFAVPAPWSTFRSGAIALLSIKKLLSS
jgi:acyl-CoA thioesterase-1